jgi:hypothetical protein
LIKRGIWILKKITLHGANEEQTMEKETGQAASSGQGQVKPGTIRYWQAIFW